jgi:predicted dehydrogenase
MDKHLNMSNYKVKVLGAGSIGNHLAFGCRTLGMDVCIVDTDSMALERTKTKIYPERYGKWDETIKLLTPEQVPDTRFDVVIIGTPPSSHLELATYELANNPPSIMLIEKPLTISGVDEIKSFIEIKKRALDTRILVGYNQRLKENTQQLIKLATSLKLGKLTGLNSNMLESWNGILGAHFWMKDEFDSYLPYTEKGGGALHEHSHALNLFLYFAEQFGQGNVSEVKGEFNWVEHKYGRYDKEAYLSLVLESGLVGTVRQDLTTWPAEKVLVSTFEKGKLYWEMGGEVDFVRLTDLDDEESEVWNFPKTRPDDFIGEIRHLVYLLDSGSTQSPIDLEQGIETMRVINAAFESDISKSSVKLNR